MPIYEYECPEHGDFEEQRPMARSSEAVPCPECGASSARVLSVTRTACLPYATRRAHDVNERSRHEPRLVQREAKPNAAAPRSVHASHGRPWAIGH